MPALADVEITDTSPATGGNLSVDYIKNQQGFTEGSSVTISASGGAFSLNSSGTLNVHNFEYTGNNGEKVFGAHKNTYDNPLEIIASGHISIIQANPTPEYKTAAVFAGEGNTIKLTAADYIKIESQQYTAVWADGSNGSGSINLSGSSVTLSGAAAAIRSINGYEINVTATSGDISLQASKEVTDPLSIASAGINAAAGAIHVLGSTVNLTASSGDINVAAPGSAVYAGSGSTVTFEAQNIKVSGDTSEKSGIALFAASGSQITFTTQNSSGSINVTGKVRAEGVLGEQNSTITFKNADKIQVTAADKAVYAGSGAEVTFEANTINVSGGTNAEDFALFAEGGSSIALSKGSVNVSGLVKAVGDGSAITLNSGSTTATSNTVTSSAAIKAEDDSITTAAYAASGGSIMFDAGSGGRNSISSTAADGDERTVWADAGGRITILGTSAIKANSSTGLALAAIGSETAGDGEGGEDSTSFYADPSEDGEGIYFNYGSGSSVSGDVAADRNGQITIVPVENAGSLTLHGNLSASNSAEVDLTLSSGSTWTGHANTYEAFLIKQDDSGEDGGSTVNNQSSLFSSALVDDIASLQSSGTVKLTMQAGSTWNINAQSWLSELSGPAGSSSTGTTSIKMAEGSTVNASSLSIGNLTGGGITFNMYLSKTADNSNMLYIGSGDGTYDIYLTRALSASELRGTGVRFASVGYGDGLTFNVYSRDTGFKNLKYLVYSDAYYQHEENTKYNGAELSETRPGTAFVDNMMKVDENTAEDELPANNQAQTDGNYQDGAVNLYLRDNTPSNGGNGGGSNSGGDGDGENGGGDETPPGVIEESISVAGQTILSMSKANYTMAVYMDTLNKRQGASRINLTGGDEGIWLRVRYDNVGRDGDYRVHNTMLELGYDEKQVRESGVWHTGFAADYMRGSTDYRNVSGDGDIDRVGAWLYATWYGDNGFYSDTIFKYGHLSSDFDVVTPYTHEKVSGDYDNNVFTLSEELGYKFSSQEGWFAEPQVQLQYSYITSADYRTTQGTKVELDDIHSLIGRAGVRLGREDLDAETPYSFYIRGDVLKEFLGDQKIKASDDTGTYQHTYKNDDVYFDVGVGISLRPSETTHLYLEAEQLLGGGFDDSYIFSAGFRHVY